MPETPADTMRRAAARLGAYPVMDDRVAVPLAALLEHAAARLDASTHPGWQELCAPHELAVARAVLGEEAGR